MNMQDTNAIAVRHSMYRANIVLGIGHIASNTVLNLLKIAKLLYHAAIQNKPLLAANTILLSTFLHFLPVLLSLICLHHPGLVNISAEVSHKIK